MAVQVIVDRPSPNYNSRPINMPPDLIVVHGTVGTDAGDLDWLTNAESGVSYHYLIQRDGTVYRLVDDIKRAWHAGRSRWQGRENCNDYSIGIGLSNDGREPFTDAQYRSAGRVCRLLCDRWHIPVSRIVGHYHVSPGRKTDPWYTFEWGRLFENVNADSA